MKNSQLLGLLDERFPLLLRELSPPLTELFGDPSMVEIRAAGDKFLSFYLTPDHESIEGSLDMFWL